MRATATGLAALAVLGLAGSLAHADPYFFGPPPAGPTCNPSFYASQGRCWYGPNYCFQGPCLPASPFNGMLAIPRQYGNGGASAGAPPYGAAGPAGPAAFATHPFARSPRDFFMYGQRYND